MFRTSGASIRSRSLFLERGYPHLGIDVLGERFTAKGFAIDDIATAFRLKIEGLAQSSRFVERDAFASCLADLLFKGGKYARACRVAQCFCSQRARASWLIEKDMPLVEKGCVLPSLDAFDSLGDAGAAASRVALARARRFVLLADVKQAVMAAARAAFDSSADESCRMQALVIVARNAETALARRATDEMHSLLAGAGESILPPSTTLPVLLLVERLIFAILAIRALARRANLSGLANPVDFPLRSSRALRLPMRPTKNPMFTGCRSGSCAWRRLAVLARLSMPGCAPEGAGQATACCLRLHRGFSACLQKGRVRLPIASISSKSLLCSFWTSCARKTSGFAA